MTFKEKSEIPNSHSKCHFGLCLVLFTISLSASTPAVASIGFNSDIRPILSDNCFHCHGPDIKTRDSGLRLDTQEGILSDLTDGRKVIIPGDPQNSEFYKRITATEADQIMPPPKSHKHLNPEDIQLLKQWIEAGAPWEDHWSFTAIQRPEVPVVPQQTRISNPIDAFILRKTQQAGLASADEADRKTLIRRVSLDLCGLPPTAEEISEFMEDNSPDAYEKMVDRYLISEKYGEHRARYWLDAARYGDTHGFHLDNYRSIWPYRDWVIDAFNRNMPFDDFTVEQLAGDMLPNPTQSQLVATGFNRCNPTTSEGGAIDDEYLAIYALDRVATTSTVWMGLTMNCASCHDHKFDPLSQKDFYQMTAFFRNTTQAAMDQNALDTKPSIRVFSESDAARSSKLESTTKKLNKQMSDLTDRYFTEPEVDTDPMAWIAKTDRQLRVSIDGHEVVKDVSQGNDTIADQEHLMDAGDQQGIKVCRDTHLDLGDVANFRIDQPFTISFWIYVPDGEYKDERVPLFGRYTPEEESKGWRVNAIGNKRIELVIQSDAATQNNLKYTTKEDFKPDSWNHVLISFNGNTQRDGVYTFNSSVEIFFNKTNAKIRGVSGKTRFYGDIQTSNSLVLGSQKPTEPKEGDPSLALKDLRIFNNLLSGPENDLLALTMHSDAIERPEDEEKDESTEASAVITKENIAQLDTLRRAQQELSLIYSNTPITLVMEEKKDGVPEAHILNRGQYDQLGERVTANIPEVFPPLPEGDIPNRLTLANWLIDPGNPLTARVNVNRFWLEVFGTGIVKTAEDFGSQGEPPSHPELLDWLASEFIESNWNVKHMYKLMLMSSTYRQSSKVTPEKLEVDPDNRFLARGARYRLDAEVIRDQALYLSNLLVDQIGGPPVRPYQPMGVWSAVAYTGSNTGTFQVDNGDKLYRRSLYTFWKRTAPPPSMSIFDAPSRESCSVRRERTNTPLQALLLMNDPQFVEAARNLAEIVLKYPRDDKLAALYELALGEEPDEKVVSILNDTYQRILATYQDDPESAEQLISIGESPVDPAINPVELATLTMVANQVMNLDVLITKN